MTRCVMIKKITKSGNSAAITIDAALLEMIHAKIGDQGCLL